AVRGGGVDEIDPRLEGQVDNPGALIGVGIAPRAEHHAPETVGAEAQSRPAQRAVFHGRQTIAYDVQRMRHPTGSGPICVARLSPCGTASTSPDPQTFCGPVQLNDGGYEIVRHTTQDSSGDR